MLSTDCTFVVALLSVDEIVGQPSKRPDRVLDLRAALTGFKTNSI